MVRGPLVAARAAFGREGIDPLVHAAELPTQGVDPLERLAEEAVELRNMVLEVGHLDLEVGVSVIHGDPSCLRVARRREPHTRLARATHAQGDGVDEALDRAKVRELLELTGGETAWLEELMATYVEDTRTRLAALRAGLDRGLAPVIQREAHGIKGSSANVGAQEVARICGDVEHLARQGDVAGARSVAADLEGAFQRVQTDLPRVLGRA